MVEDIFQICNILSSATDAITQSSVALNEKSKTFEVCPPWMKSNSGGPSSASSGDCSCPILDVSHTITRRSSDEEARIVSSLGDQFNW